MNNNIIDSSIIADSLKHIRLTHNMSQEEFAKVLNVSPKLVSKWENGARIPRIETFKLINKKYGITFEEITTGLFKPELTQSKAIKYLFKHTLTKYIIIILVIIIMFLSVLINNNTVIYTISVETNNINIPDGNIILNGSNHMDIIINKIDIANFINGKINVNVYINDNKQQLLYSCKYINDSCLETFKIQSTNNKFIKQNINNIYVDIINEREHIKTKLRLQKYDSDQSVRNLIVLPNGLIKTNDKKYTYKKCINVNKRKMLDKMKYYSKMIKVDNDIYFVRYNKTNYIINNGDKYIVFPKNDEDIFLGYNGNIENYWNINNNRLCFDKEDSYYTLLKNIINYYD